MTPVSLALRFHHEPGHSVVPSTFPIDPLVAAIQERLVELGLIEVPVPLDTLHHALPAKAMAFNEHYSNAVNGAFYARHAGIQTAYLAIIRQLRSCIAEDFLFQAQAILRFHFPVPFHAAMKSQRGLPRQLHSDLLGGHPAEMIQGWMALTDCSETATLQCSTRREGLALLENYRLGLTPADPPFADSLLHFYGMWDQNAAFGEAITAACTPRPLKAGELLLFDPHCLHGGTENRESTTRVSLDFRILPLHLEATAQSSATTETAMRFKRGALFHEQSAWELT